MADEIAILLADDYPVVRKGLKASIEEEPDLKVIAEAGAVEEVHSGDDLTADEITTVGVGVRERIATRAITRSGVPIEIHTPTLIGGCHLGERLRV